MSAVTEERRAGLVLEPGRTRRSFPEEFRADAVALVLDEGRMVASVARGLGVGGSNLGDWVRRARVGRGEREGLTSGERAGLVRFRRENARLRMERDLLKRATALWAKESGRWPAVGGWLPGGPRGSRRRCAAAWPR